MHKKIYPFSYPWIYNEKCIFPLKIYREEAS